MTPEQAQQRAHQLATLYDDFEWLDFYLKCIHRLPEGKLQYIVESARNSRNPRNYFKRAAKKEMDNGNLQD